MQVSGKCERRSRRIERGHEGSELAGERRAFDWRNERVVGRIGFTSDVGVAGGIDRDTGGMIVAGAAHESGVKRSLPIGAELHDETIVD